MCPKDKEHPLKKLAMIVLWRTQQIAQPFSLAMLAITLALTVNAYIEWRFSNTYIGIIIALTTLVIIILISGFLWDRVRMWHEQNVVTVERNPYCMHKMAPKEIVHFTDYWIPMGKALGKALESSGFQTEGREMISKADSWSGWCKDQMGKDPHLKTGVEELQRRYFGKESEKK